MTNEPRRSLGGPLHLADEGMFFVGAEPIRSEHPGVPPVGTAGPGLITRNGLYVHYRIPEIASGPPVVMVHGSNHTGVTYETTPDGREGWATYFARRGFPVYVVDHAGRGRSGFDPTAINRARETGSADGLPNLVLRTRESAWTNFRFGPHYPDFWPDTQFPTQALEDYWAQLVPNTEATLTDEREHTIAALVALLDRIGPAILVVHSQSGAYGLEVVRRRAALLRAFVNLEGDCAPVSADDVRAHLKRVPLLCVWGDHSEGAIGANGDARRNGCAATVDAVAAAGGRATLMLLPALGIPGNTHMLTMDRNNLAVADRVIAWLDESARESAS